MIDKSEIMAFTRQFRLRANIVEGDTILLMKISSVLPSTITITSM